MIDWTKPIRVRHSKAPAKVLCIDLKNDDYPIVIRFFLDDKEFTTVLTQIGHTFKTDEIPFVENIQEMIEGYVNVYKEKLIIVHETLDSAKKYMASDCVARIKVCHPVGQFDE